MSMNGKQRARWLSDVISETQRYLAKAKETPEAPMVQRALNELDDARRKAAEDASD